MEAQRNWYVIHTYSGYENKVKTNLEQKIHSTGMDDCIFRVEVPMEDDVEIKDGRRQIKTRKMFPGYVLVEMIVTDQSWYVVRNTPGVTGFVGEGTKPIALTPSEVEHILHQADSDKPRIILDVRPGEAVHINSGPFEDFPATVVSVDHVKGKLTVSLDMFGRDTAVTLDFDQVEKL